MKYKYDSFVLHYEQYKIVETLQLNYEQKGRLLDLIFGYAKDGTIPPNTPDLVKGAFAGIKVRMDEDREKYNAKRQRMDKINEDRRNDDNARNRDEIVTKSHENGCDTVTVTDTVTDTDTDTDTHTPLPPQGECESERPSLVDISAYIENQIAAGKKGYTFCAQEIYDEWNDGNWHTAKGEPITIHNWRPLLIGLARYRANNPDNSQPKGFAIGQANTNTYETFQNMDSENLFK